GLAKCVYYRRTFGFLATAASAIALLAFFTYNKTNSVAIASKMGGFLINACLITWVTAAWRQSRLVPAPALAPIGDGVVVTDRDGRITFLNTVAETLTGWSSAEAHHQPAEDILRLIDERSRKTIENPLTRALRDRAVVTTVGHTVLVSRSG